MTAIASTTLDNPPKAVAVADPARQYQPDLFTALLGSAGQAASVETAKDASGIGRLGATPAAPKRSRKAVDAAAAQMDPTKVAVNELASRGAPKASVEAAVHESTTPENAGARSASKPRAQAQTAPTASNEAAGMRPAAKDGQTNTAVARTAAAPAAPTTPAVANPIVSANQTRTRTATTGVAPLTAPAAMNRLVQAGTPTVARVSAANSRPVVRPVIALQAQGKPGQSAKAKPEAAAPPRNQEAEFAEQLSRGFSAILRQNGGSLTLRLEPQELGEMTIKMDLKPGKVAAAFEVESEQAQQLLGSNLSALRSALEARGLAVDSFTVHVNDKAVQDAPTRAEPESSHGGAGNPEGGATGDRGGTGTDRPTADGAWSPPRSEALPEAGATGVDMGGAQVVRLAIDATA